MFISALVLGNRVQHSPNLSRWVITPAKVKPSALVPTIVLNMIFAFSINLRRSSFRLICVFVALSKLELLRFRRLFTLKAGIPCPSFGERCSSSTFLLDSSGSDSSVFWAHLCNRDGIFCFLDPVFVESS